ncbi:MAG: hypothetical protein FWG69_05255 [Oscillospiraceae bacterium]|nr:hypothetical protein [Oscillospiraceae bacterium]
MKQNTLISQLLSALPEDRRDLFGGLMEHLTKLGYLPQKQAVKTFTLSFKRGRQVIAKIRVCNGGEFCVKFFACEDPPQKYRDALRRDIEAQNEQYWGLMSPNRPAHLKNKCDGCGTACTGGNMGYYWKFEDDREIFRCGAYPILISDISIDDLAEAKRLLAEQDSYFKVL